MSARVTILLPVYNPGRLLERAVRSLVSQTLKDWVLLIIDDGSDDGSLNSFEFAGDPRIQILRDGRRLGLAARLNQGIDVCTTPYLARMDHDDICVPDRLLLQVAHLDAHPEDDLVGGACVLLDPSGRLIGPHPFGHTHEEISHRPWKGFYLPHPSWMGRTRWFKMHRYANPAPYRCEDQELLLRTHEVSRFHALELPVLFYSVHRRPLTVQLKTRFAMAAFQASYFLKRGRYGSAVLSCVAGLLRAAREIIARALLQVSGGAKRLRSKQLETLPLAPP